MERMELGALRVTIPCLALTLGDTAAMAQTRTLDAAAIDEMFGRAEREGRVGIARKTREVDVRPAKVGEVVVTTIMGEGEETRSKPAAAGDRVVRNRCPATGNEEYLVKAREFPERYEGPLARVDATWEAYRLKGMVVRYLLVPAEVGAFTFKAPWGEAMQVRPGDAIVRNPTDPRDTYRVAATSFACTYEIVDKPRAG